MATVQVVFAKAGAKGVQVMAAGFSANEIITSSATSQATTASASQANDVVMIVASGGNVYVNVAAAPTAAADATSLLILDGERVPLSVNSGDKVAVIDA